MSQGLAGLFLEARHRGFKGGAVRQLQAHDRQQTVAVKRAQRIACDAGLAQSIDRQQAGQLVHEGLHLLFFFVRHRVGTGLGLLGAAVVAGAVIGQASRGRGKRDVETVAALQIVDSYFMTILDVDVDDCGKKLVCEILSLDAADRNVEESLIATMFEASSTIDPLSAKAEYDLAAFVGANYDKAVCARRYHRCSYDRKTIMQAIRKLEREEESQQTEA